jgi:cell division protein FtsN
MNKEISVMKKALTLSILLFCFFIQAVAAQQVWQGNAAVIRRGGFETSGLFAASNSFPKNTKIEVVNLENGKVVTVTVVKRIDDGSNVFLLLSSEAADKLDMEYNDVIRVKTTLLGGYGTDIAGLPGDLPYNPDEDINPAAGAPDEYYVEKNQTTTETHETTQAENSQPTNEHPQNTETTQTTEIPPETTKDQIADRNPQKDLYTTPHEDKSITVYDRPQAEKEDTRLSNKNVELKEAQVAQGEKPTTSSINKPTPKKEQVNTVLAEAELPLKEETAATTDINKPSPEKENVTAVLPAATPPGHEEATVEEMAKTSPETAEVDVGKLETPGIEEKEKPTVSEMAKVTPEKEELVYSSLITPEVEQKEKPDVEEVANAQKSKEEIILGELNTPNVEQKEKPSLEDVNKVNTPEQTELALVPTNPRPPSKETITETTQQTTTHEIPPEVEVTTSTVLLKNKYYCQIGAYQKQDIAEKVAKTYTSYPTNVVATQTGNTRMYKVLIGPLNKDESGAVLYWFRAKGHRDAFLKYIKDK